MKAIEEAFNAAYQKDINMIYSVLSQAILLANNDEIEINKAEERFKTGLAHAADIKKRARICAGLE